MTNVRKLRNVLRIKSVAKLLSVAHDNQKRMGDLYVSRVSKRSVFIGWDACGNNSLSFQFELTPDQANQLRDWLSEQFPEV